MTYWNPDNVRDVAESVGISSLGDDVLQSLSRDVEYRLSQVLEEALKFMRHSKRMVLSTQDISQALRVLDVEPLYGYESTRPLRFGEASLGPGQPLFYVEDEEVDFEKLINAPLPKVPKEISFTAHWLAVEGVQPSIPQNPSSTDSRSSDLISKAAGANAGLASISGGDNVTVKPLVKHILSKELQIYFERISLAILDESNDDYRLAAFSSLRSDPGLHQLVPYFVQFIAEKVTHNMKNLFVLTQMMHLTASMLDNESLFIEPYVASIIPPILTCLIGRRLGDPTNPLAHFSLRDLAASLILAITKKYATSSHTLKPRLARTLLKNFLDPYKPLGVHYGAICGLQAIGGPEVVKVLIVPNLKTYEEVVRDELVGGDDEGGVRRAEAEMVVRAVVKAVGSLEGARKDGVRLTNGWVPGEETRERLVEIVGEVVGGRIWELERWGLVRAIVEGASAGA
ncbi:MAG: hypothetical protein M1839_008980 [Geoglossum umbratile]|nr:MAG: hypothetical protein M1839_008980 [Geoglossum umbratile]